MTGRDELRNLPSVDELVSGVAADFENIPHKVLVDEARRLLASLRTAMKTGEAAGVGSIGTQVQRAVKAILQPSLRLVINATGVILHTNLGRAPVPLDNSLQGYSNLEYDLETGRRGKRDVHVTALLERLLGHGGIVVNNNAAAVYLVLNELAAGSEVIVSRGELIEIGDGFRIPDIMARSGAILREVGTTNRTRLEDYRAAINERTRLLMRVHRSNFRIEGFTASPSLNELARLAKERGLPVYEDLGSGCLVDLSPYGIDEPLARASLDAGASLVSFSGDKLLGGPQAGIIAGRAELVQRIRRNPMFRALRVDKLTYAALEHTLRLVLLERFEEIPTLRMIRLPASAVRLRAERLMAAVPGLVAELKPGTSVIGGGSTPQQSIPTYLIALSGQKAADLERALRRSSPPVISRIEDDRVVLDLRTVEPAEEPELERALQALS
ncbi:MAG TPA: L-seryl-tRNA(Sec) selenium transferase [Bryobacteraceae bacterium]|nr:L-seryl-tRNA(Sec) selenium transferase [Bryobacteraceae bacterium]